MADTFRLIPCIGRSIGAGRLPPLPLLLLPLLLLPLLLLSMARSAQAQPARAAADCAHGHWIGTWNASVQPPFNFPGAPAPPPVRFANETVRMIVHTSIGGRCARVSLSNRFGRDALSIGAAHIALRGHGGAIVPGSDRPLTFSGNASIIIPAGAQVISDPAELDVPQLGDLSVSIYLPGEAATSTQHRIGLHPVYVAGPGDLTAAADMSAAPQQTSWYWLEGIDVTAPAGAGVVETLGDSITDGFRSTLDANATWPDELARRLLSRAAGAPELAVLNAGISGNRLLHDVIGPNALSRFNEDVLVQPGVRYVIVLLGINDIGFSGIQLGASQDVTAAQLIAALRQLIERAHVHAVKVLGATLTPFEGAMYYSAAGESKRQTVNHWIRSAGAFDGVVDFDAAVRDPAHPAALLAAYDSSDHLHPNDAGYAAMGKAIDLQLFAKARGH